MQAPDPQTNLSEKFTALREQMTTQYDALVLKLDALRGEGPENTLKSINQSLWNIAGPAPGTTLTDLYGLLSKINNGIGGWPDGYTPPGGIPLLNARELLSQINSSASFLSLLFDATGYSGDTTLLSVLSDLLLQFNTSVVYPTMKDLMLTISQQQAQLVALAGDPLSVVPPGVCDEPFVSSGVAVIPVSGFTANAVTIARWDFSQSTEFEAGEILGLSGDVVIKTISEPIDWSGYKFYVASEASTFGAAYLDPARHATNQWVTLEDYHQSLSITIDGEGVNLKVYICGANAPAAIPVCDGYGTLQQYGPFTFVPGTIDGDDTYKSYPSGMFVPGLTITQDTYHTTYPDTIEFFSSSVDMDCCVTLVSGGSCGYTSFSYRAELGQAVDRYPLHAGIAGEARSWVVSLIAGELYTLMSTDIVGSLELYLTPQVAS
jgi:hypothetical protein